MVILKECIHKLMSGRHCRKMTGRRRPRRRPLLAYMFRLTLFQEHFLVSEHVIILIKHESLLINRDRQQVRGQSQ